MLFKQFKNTKKRVKQLLKYKSMKIAAGFLGVFYVYIVGLFAQMFDKPKNLSPFELSQKKVSMSFFRSIGALFTNSRKFLVFGFALLLLFIILSLIHLRINSIDEDTWDERGFYISKDGTYGTSGWMTRDEIDEALQVATIEETYGTILGKLDPEPEEGFATEAFEIVSLPPDSPLNKHTAVYGASGTGKSRSFVRPQIMQCVKRGESVVVTDPKGEMYEDTAEYLRDKGYNVRVFNLVDPQYSDSWNCLAEITHDPNKVELMAQTFADVIINNTANGKGDPFWDKSEMNLLKSLSLYVALDEYRTPDQRTIGAVYDMLTENSEEQLFAMFDKLPKHHPARQPWGIFKQGSDAVRGNTIVGLGSRLQVFQSQVIRSITSVSDIDLEDIGKEKTALFVIMSDQDGTLSFISSLFFSFMFIRLVRYADNQPSRAVDVPVNFILDEFPNIGQIPDFTKKLSTIRSRELRVAVIFQNISQLQNRYPDGLWEEIIGNCDTQLFLGCSDATTAEFISERTGEITIEVTSSRVNRQTMKVAQHVPEYSESSSEGKRYLLTPDEVLRLHPRTALVILRGQKILKVNKFDYSMHHDADLFRGCKIHDYVPSWRDDDFEPSFSIENIIKQDEEFKKKREIMLKKRGEIEDDEFTEDDFVDESSSDNKKEMSEREKLMMLLNRKNKNTETKRSAQLDSVDKDFDNAEEDVDELDVKERSSEENKVITKEVLRSYNSKKKKPSYSNDSKKSKEAELLKGVMKEEPEESSQKVSGSEIKIEEVDLEAFVSTDVPDF